MEVLDDDAHEHVEDEECDEEKEGDEVDEAPLVVVHLRLRRGNEWFHNRLRSFASGHTVCACVISFMTIRPWALISTSSKLDAAASESSYPFGDTPIKQPVLFQTLVGHSVIVVRHVCSLVGN